jgi:hypothetical protein
MADVPASIVAFMQDNTGETPPSQVDLGRHRPLRIGSWTHTREWRHPTLSDDP